MNSIEYLFHSFQMKRLLTFWYALKLMHTCKYNAIFEGKRLILKQNIATMLMDTNICTRKNVSKRGPN